MYRRNTFTLIELLVTITVIAILSGLTIGGVRFAFRRSEEASIRSRMQAMEMALQEHKDDYGYYPVWPAQPWTASETFYENASCDMNFDMVSPAGKNYLENMSTTPFRQTGGGPAMRYQYPGAKNPEKYDLAASGVDESFADTADNITNWQKR